MGESGPLDLCSEIHVDLRSEEEKQNFLGVQFGLTKTILKL